MTPGSEWTPDDIDHEVDDDDDDDFSGDDCGRWSNGRLTSQCSLAGTEHCDWECPFHGRTAKELGLG